MESIIVYFIIFLVISALLKRLTQAQSRRSEEVKVPPRRPSGQVPQRPVPPSPRPHPSTYPPRPTEAQEEGLPSISQVLDELRERRRPIGELLREEIERVTTERVQEKAEKPMPPVLEPVQEQPKPSPVQQPSPVPRKEAAPLSRLSLRFDLRSVRQGIIFSEILGPPRAER